MTNNSLKKEMPLVSICTITYNHKNYIAQAIESFLMQKTNFLFEILIHDDASSDGTSEIIKEYELKYPDLIFPIYQKENQYSKGVSISATYNWPRAKGKYIALCEGDDYWTDPFKLQKQVDFLENNIEFSICFHDVDIVFDDNVEERFKDSERYQIQYENDNVVFDFDDLLENGNLMHTPSVVFKTPTQWPFFTAITGDYFLHLHNASNGKIKRLKDRMAVYRVHSGGIFSIKEKWSFEKLLEYFIKQADAYWNLIRNGYCKSKKQKKIALSRMCSYNNNARIYSLLEKKYQCSRSKSFLLLRFFWSSDVFSIKLMASALLTLIFPRLYGVRVKRKNDGTIQSE